MKDYLTYIKRTNDNLLVKIKLTKSSAMEEAGITADSFCHVLDNFAVRHIFTKHSNQKGKQRGQIIIEESDFFLIPEILKSYDCCKTTISPSGKKILIYSKIYPDCERFYVEEVREGRHELAGVSYYKRKRKLTGAKS